MHATTPTPELMWPAATGLEHPAEIERIPLEDRGLPESTYHALVRAAELWPERPAISCLPDAERWERPATRTFAELADDVHRAASVYAGLGVGRRDAVAILSVNCSEMITAVLAAEAVGIAAPVNPALAAGHAAELVRLSGAKVIVAAGPELDAARLVAGPGGSPPRPAPARSSRCGRPRRGSPRRSSSRWRARPSRISARSRREAPADGLDGRGAAGRRSRELPAHRRDDRHAEARGAHAPQRGRQRLDGRPRHGRRRVRRRVRRAAAVPHERARRHAARPPAARPARRLGGAARLPRAVAVRRVLEDRRAVSHRGHVRGADGVRGARRACPSTRTSPACGCRSSAPRRCRPRSPTPSAREPASRCARATG